MSLNADITIRKGDSLEGSLRRFKKECGKERVVQDFRQRCFFTSKKEILRSKKLKAKRNQQVKQQKQRSSDRNYGLNRRETNRWQDK